MNDLDLRLWQARFRDYMTITKDWSPRTIEFYSAELKPFFGFLERQGITSLARLTRVHLEGYRLELHHVRYKDRLLTRATQQKKLVSMIAFIRYLFRENYLLMDLAAHFEYPKRSIALPRTVLSEKEVVQMIDSLDVGEPKGIRDRAILELLYGTGLRNTELRTLRLDQLELDRKMMRVEGKGRKIRMLPLGEEAQAWLEEYLLIVRPQLVLEPEQKLVFLGWRGKPLRRSWLAELCSQLARQAGLEKKVTPHVLRHSCATHMLRRGAGLRQLQCLLGHSNLNTTQIYTRVEISDLAKAVRRFHPREQP